MNKIYLTICILLLATGIGISQKKGGIGINTENPQAIFHIDAKKNTGDIPNPVNTSDDVVFTTIDSIYGMVGIGKINPDVSLDINGNIRLEDGNQTNANILVSIDSLGNAKWIEPSRPLIKTGQIGDNIHLDEIATDLTEEPIILSHGRWLILSKFVIKPTKLPPSKDDKPINNVWIYLKNVTEYPQITDTIYNTVLGVPVEQAGDLAGLTGTPQLAALVNIPKGENHEFRIFGSTSNVKFEYVTSNTKFQGSFFYAVRLDADLID